MGTEPQEQMLFACSCGHRDGGPVLRDGFGEDSPAVQRHLLRQAEQAHLSEGFVTRSVVIHRFMPVSQGALRP